MAGLLTKGIKLGYKTSSSATSYTDLTNLQEIPDLGGDVDTVEVTTLADAAHTYIAGLKDYGDSLDFVFLYDPTQFGTLNALTGVIYWQVSLPDGENGAISTGRTFNPVGRGLAPAAPMQNKYYICLMGQGPHKDVAIGSEEPLKQKL
jgi:hypothetical protein